MSNPLVILGAGGFAHETFAWALQTGRRVVAFYDEFLVGSRVIHHTPVVSSLDGFKGAEFVAAVGDPATRAKLVAQAALVGLQPCHPIIHPSVVVGGDVLVGLGSVICPGSILTWGVKVGGNVILNLNATVGHDAELGDFVTVSPGANISGNVRIGEGSYIGTNAAIREKVRIGKYAVIGMGAVVLRDVEEAAVMVGNPARQRVAQSVS